MGRLLRTLGLWPQRPLWRAWQADPEAVQRWKDEEFPAIRAQAEAEGATIYFGDEAGIRSDYHAGTTWAPAGQTPVVKATGARHSLKIISAVTAQGLLRFSTYTGSFTAARLIEFCRKLLADTDRPVYLVVDGHPTHRWAGSRPASRRTSAGISASTVDAATIPAAPAARARLRDVVRPRGA